MKMTTTITAPHRHRFEEIKTNLNLLGHKEASFLKVQLLFYEALDIAKNYGSDPQINVLLSSLRRVQMDTYEKTKEVCRTQKQKERLIYHFVVQFKKAIAEKQILAS